MNYKKIYDDLMESRLLLKLERFKDKTQGVYFEGHHIIPKSKGGQGNSSKGLNHPNIVLLTAREHFLAHWLLWRIHRDRSSALAFHKMMSSNNHQKRNKSSRGYEEARLAFSETNKGNQYGKGKTKIISEEQKRNHSILMKGRYSGEANPFYGKIHNDESRRKISENAKLRCGNKSVNYKGIKQIFLNGDLIAEFDTSQEVAKFIGCSHGNVRHVLGGKQKTAKGFEIKYKQLV
jgi:hypothetical protein